MLTARLAICLALLLVAIPSPSLADPPPWAPAHGWRGQDRPGGARDCPPGLAKKGRCEGRSTAAAAPVDPAVEQYRRIGSAVGIADGTCNKEVVGGLVGAGAGGLLGSKVGKGDGRLAATAAGAVLGYLIGSSLGRWMDEVDQNCVGQALERAPQGRTVAWTDPTRDARYEVTPTRTYRDADRYCREYVLDAVTDGRAETVRGTACRNPDGTWSRR